MINELPSPSVIDREKSFELVRIWAASGDLTFVITDRLWSDPAAWGIVVADLIKHISTAYDRAGRGEVADQIKKALEAEWNTPTG